MHRPKKGGNNGGRKAYPSPFHRQSASIMTKWHVIKATNSIISIPLIFKVNKSKTYKIEQLDI